jgi:glycosyl transferase family 25
MWEFIDKVVYINLARRPDRNEHIKRVTQVFGDKVIRFDAIEAPSYIGCTLSHIGVLELASKNNWKNVLIMEDDAEWNEFDMNYKRLETLASQPYDVIMLGGVAVHKYPNNKLISAQTSAAYLVSSHYYSKLITIFKEANELLTQTGDERSYATDQYWKKYQHVDNWYIISEPCMVYQRPDYSNILNTFVDYREAFQL